MLKAIIKLIKQLFNPLEDLAPYRKKIMRIKVELHQIDKNKDYYKLRDLFIRTDAMLFRICKVLGCGKDSVGEQLKSDKAKRMFTRDVLNNIWSFHKIRNKVVHEDYMPDKKDMYYIAKILKVLEKLT